jgi:hypothetical protein
VHDERRRLDPEVIEEAIHDGRERIEVYVAGFAFAEAGAGKVERDAPEL